jgi:hypothetical protein
MIQGLGIGGAANQLVEAVHGSAVALGMVPVPTIIVVGLATVFALVALVVNGRARDRAPRHAHRAHRA